MYRSASESLNRVCACALILSSTMARYSGGGSTWSLMRRVIKTLFRYCAEDCCFAPRAHQALCDHGSLSASSSRPPNASSSADDECSPLFRATASSRVNRFRSRSGLVLQSRTDDVLLSCDEYDEPSTRAAADACCCTLEVGKLGPASREVSASLRAVAILLLVDIPRLAWLL